MRRATPPGSRKRAAPALEVGPNATPPGRPARRPDRRSGPGWLPGPRGRPDRSHGYQGSVELSERRPVREPRYQGREAPARRRGASRWHGPRTRPWGWASTRPTCGSSSGTCPGTSRAGTRRLAARGGMASPALRDDKRRATVGSSTSWSAPPAGTGPSCPTSMKPSRIAATPATCAAAFLSARGPYLTMMTGTHTTQVGSEARHRLGGRIPGLTGMRAPRTLSNTAHAWRVAVRGHSSPLETSDLHTFSIDARGHHTRCRRIRGAAAGPPEARCTRSRGSVCAVNLAVQGLAEARWIQRIRPALATFSYGSVR
jgi:hypothetical protein